MKSARTSVSLPNELRDELKPILIKHGSKISSLVRALLKDYIEKDKGQIK